MSSMKCRVCLGGGEMINIFEEWKTYKISTKLVSLTKVEICLEDKLPKTICRKCVKKLDQCIDFIQLCKSSDEKLRTAMVGLKSEDCNCNKHDCIENNSMDPCIDEKYYLDTSKCNKNKSISSQNQIKSKVINKDTLLSTGSSVEENSSTKAPRQLNEKSDIKEIKKLNKAQCYVCGKILSTVYRLKNHLRSHTEERPFSCQHCSKSYKNCRDLSVHMIVHTGKRPFKCIDCDATFQHGSTLKTHRRKHTGETPYHCTLCPRRFFSASHFQYHIKKHTGEKNFECDTCGKTFTGRSHLTTHLLSHSGEQPHMCSLCGARFSRSCNLKRHFKQKHISHKLQGKDEYKTHMLDTEKSLNHVEIEGGRCELVT